VPAAALAKSAAPRTILLVKTSSLGDVVHNLPVVSDLHTVFPEAAIDWVVEEALVDIPRLHPAVRRVLPVGLRRWRKSLLTAQSWREMAAFRRELQTEAYDLVLDTQGLVKSGLIVRQARLATSGRRCGYAAEAAREPLAARFYHNGFVIPKNLHAVERNRWLAAAALDYVADMPLDYGVTAAHGNVTRPGWLPQGNYAVLLTATSREDKLWPEEHWLQLAAGLAECGLSCILPAGAEDERRRATRLTQQMSRALVAPSLEIAEIARVCAGARLVVGVDTGLTHLAVALERPTLALFCGSDPHLTGVHGGDADRVIARNLGGPGRPPGAQEAIAAAFELLA
jgi:heptosyltransferase-1